MPFLTSWPARIPANSTSQRTVAFADGNVDKYEEALIRQVAELIYVPHSDYIQSKLTVRDEFSPVPALT